MRNAIFARQTAALDPVRALGSPTGRNRTDDRSGLIEPAQEWETGDEKEERNREEHKAKIRKSGAYGARIRRP
jgi:hypothetical protein